MEKMLLDYCGLNYVVMLEAGVVRRVEPAVGSTTGMSKCEAADLMPDLASFTEFERCVLERAMQIPRGKVATYGELARAVEKSNASRAVGNVMAKNPIPIIVPCHRVLKSDLTIGEYAHGSEVKKALLIAEGVFFDGDRVRRECLHRF